MITEDMQNQLAMAGQIASKRVTYLLNRDFNFKEHRILVGCRIDTSGKSDVMLYCYASTAGLFFRITPNKDMTDIIISLVSAADTTLVEELKTFFNKLPESFTTNKPNTSKN